MEMIKIKKQVLSLVLIGVIAVGNTSLIKDQQGKSKDKNNKNNVTYNYKIDPNGRDD